MGPPGCLARPTTSRLVCFAGEEGAGDAGAAGGAPDAVAAAAAAAAAGTGAGAGAADPEKPFYETFADANLKTHPSVQRFKTPEDLAHGFVSLEKRFGVAPERRIDLPADPNDKAAMRAVYAKLGMPEKPEGYGLTLADNATEADKAFLGRALGRMHELGVPADMAKGVFELWMAEGQQSQAAAQAAAEAHRAAGLETLKQAWGGDFDRRAKEIGLMMARHGAPDLAKELDTGDKLGNHPQLALFLSDVLDAIAEPGDAGGAGAGAADGAMTPSQAMAAVRALEGDPIKGKALRDQRHAQHRDVVAERARLLAMTAP